MSYQPPVEIGYGPTRHIEGDIDEAVMLTIEQTINIKVDKDELIRAMQYDRGHYEKGYADGAASQTRHGRWSYGYNSEAGMLCHFCTACGKEAYWDTDYGQQLFKFCPNCGADMREEGADNG